MWSFLGSVEELITHALHALSSSLGNDQEMTRENVELGFLGKDCKFRKLTATEIENYLLNVETKKPSRMVVQVRIIFFLFFIHFP